MGDFYDERRVTARKEHRCFHCGGEIPIGLRYVYICGVYCSDFFIVKSHVNCNDLLQIILDESGDDEFDSDTVITHLHETMCSECSIVDDRCSAMQMIKCGSDLLIKKEV